MEPTITMGECVNGGLYRINSRNLDLGVYAEKTKGFVGVRTKFNDTFLFTEYHHDTGHGTVHPKELLEQCPLEDIAEGHSVIITKENKANYHESFDIGDRIFIENKELREYLDSKRKADFFKETPEDSD